MPATGLSADLDWWRTHRADADPAALRALLERLHAWKARHDEDRAAMGHPFFEMVWDGVFGDDDGDVVAAIGEIEAALDARA